MECVFLARDSLEIKKWDVMMASREIITSRAAQPQRDLCFMGQKVFGVCVCVLC